jgi:alkylation response protein AidB-like acyl-CoA dehydrogenase
MTNGAGHYLVWCALDGLTDMGKALVVALVPADTPGMATDGKWDTLGMRATYSPSVTFTGCAIEDDAVIGEPGGALQVGVIEGFALGYAAIYLGIAESALDFAIDYAKQRVFKPATVPIAHEPMVQRHVGELSVKRDAAAALLALAAAAWEKAAPPERAVLGSRAKYLATEAGLEITSRAIQLVGGRGAYKDHPVERAFRDLRTCTLMVPSVDRMLESIGKHALGVETGMFNVAGAPPAP